jgi:hypothetical protein
MTLEQLKAQYAATYRAAKAEGVQLEHERVCAHITLGLKCGDTRTVIAALRSGADLSMEIQAQYMSAAINREDIRLYQAETDEAAAAIENAKRPNSTHADDFGEAVLDRLSELVAADESEE